MNVINPSAAIVPINATADNFQSREERQYQLPLNQIVRATVSEGGFDRAMLEMANRRIPVETKVPLQTGQKLDLLVVTTQARPPSVA